jgi:hypothetical protein
VESRTLKTGPARSVRLELPGGSAGADAPRVVKRFAGRGLFAAARDAARARREHELLVELHGRGLPVPRPLAIERRDDGWEVAMQWIPRAQSLQQRLLAGRTLDLPARALGELLARLQAAGVDHPDLHPGNVLIDDARGVWAIDFHKARAGARLSAARLEAQLAHLEAGLRERAPARFRARCLLSWLRSLPPDLPRPRGSKAELAARIAERARRERCATVEKRRLRWTRPGSAVRAVSLAGGDGFERADGPPDVARSLEAALERSGSGAARQVLACPAAPARRVLVLRGPWRAVGAAWYAAARLEEHHLPAARPLAVARASRSWAAFALPGDGHLLQDWSALGERGLLALRALAAQLCDRGLALEGVTPEHLWRSADGALSIAGAPRLARALDDTFERALARWRRVLGAADYSSLCAAM